VRSRPIWGRRGAAPSCGCVAVGGRAPWASPGAADGGEAAVRVLRDLTATTWRLRWARSELGAVRVSISIRAPSAQSLTRVRGTDFPVRDVPVLEGQEFQHELRGRTREDPETMPESRIRTGKVVGCRRKNRRKIQ
jgi:hypothetical protein